MSELIEIFTAGIILGNGPCLFICVPIVLPYIGGLVQTDSGKSVWKAGIKLALVFSVSRLFAYSLLGLLSTLFYKFVFGVIGMKGVCLQFILGVLIIIIALLHLFSINQKFALSNPLCRFFRSKLTEKPKFNMVLFGLLVGFSACPPLLAVLTYIAAIAKDPLWGLMGGFVFGLGTLITPLIPLAAFTGFIIDRIKKSSVILMAVRVLSTAILLYFGVRLIVNQLFFGYERLLKY
ncbi:MAG: sulfite exporter TauE/SafE family protein [Candidatus Omnitrophica bacterium]|nr:sulfite exporter TauE/SafE family protein [Candidatus Omnitrophota bacterium]